MTRGICAGVAALGIALACATDALPAHAAGSPILVIDRHAIMTGSKLGQNISQQIMAYENQVQHDLGPEGAALESEIQAFQQQSASLPADVRAKRNQALQAKQAAYRQKLQERQDLIQGGEMVARKFYLGQIGLVVHAALVERGADVVLEKSAVVDGINGLDVTQEVIQRLDKKVASFKVPLVKPPPEEMLQMQRHAR